MGSGSDVLVAFDPGGTTGYSILHLTKRKDDLHLAVSASTVSYDRVWHGGQFEESDHHKTLWNFLCKLDPDMVVCENFVYQLRKLDGVAQPGIELISRDYIGVIKLYCQLTGKPLTINPPSIIGLPWVSNDVLKSLGAYVPGHPHENDAARHALYHAVHNLKRNELLRVLRKKST